MQVWQLFWPLRPFQGRFLVYYATWSPFSYLIYVEGLLAAAIIHLNGKRGRPGWAWIVRVNYSGISCLSDVLFLNSSLFLYVHIQS
jgi:hypothetical protein